MNSAFRTSSTPIALMSIILLVYVGYCYGVFFSIAPANWYLPTDPLSWMGKIFQMAYGGLSLMAYLIFPPCCFVTGPAIVCAFLNRPRKFVPQQLSLALPIIPILALPIWAAYVSLHRPMTSEWGAYQNGWEMRVLESAAFAALVPLVAGVVLVLALPSCKGQRTFSLSLLFLECCVLALVFLATSSTVANVWL